MKKLLLLTLIALTGATGLSAKTTCSLMSQEEVADYFGRNLMRSKLENNPNYYTQNHFYLCNDSSGYLGVSNVRQCSSTATNPKNCKLASL